MSLFIYIALVDFVFVCRLGKVEGAPGVAVKTNLLFSRLK